ncbi:MAG: sensor histidine kinase [Micropepsaceae bacterium]
MTAWLPAGWQKVVAVIAAGAVSWLLIVWVDIGAPAIADLRVEKLELASVPRPDIGALREANFVTASGRFRHEGRFGVARIRFNVGDPRTSDLALFILRVRDNYAVYVNGRLAAAAPGVMADRSTLHGFHPRFTRLLPALLVPGSNTVDILSARNATQTALRAVYFGPAARLEPAYRHSFTLVHDNAEIAALAAAIVLLFALALSPLVRPALTLTIALTLALFLARLLHTLWINEPWTQMLRDVYLNVVAPLIWIAVSAFINEWTNGPPQYRRWFVVTGAVCCFAVAGFYAALDCAEANRLASLVESFAGVGALSFLLLRLTRHYVIAPANAAPEIFVACVGLVMACASVATQNEVLPILLQASIQGEAFAQLGALSIVGFIAMGLARYGIGVYQLATLNNETLARRVAEKELQLEANHALLRDQERERTLTTERSRIMRDVHDGIGSQLLGLLVQARGGAAKPEAMTAGLQAAIDDLYLVVDSLDGVDGSLETALGTFRTRIEPKCAAAGIGIRWQVEDIGPNKAQGPAAVLQIYRILQEALSNAIRHGKPNRVVFELKHDKTNDAIVLSLHDNGTGFDVAKQQIGRGLANMRNRAASIGAQLNVVSNGEGTLVKLSLPLQA